MESKAGVESRSLSPGEHRAFHELARQLAARLQNADAVEAAAASGELVAASDSTAPDAAVKRSSADFLSAS